MKFKLLSKNTMVLINELLKNNNLLKLIDNNSGSPYTEKEIINGGSLVMNKILPSPETGDVPLDQMVVLRVFFPDGQLENRVILGTTVFFQIVLPKGLWNIVDENGTKCLRPYEIMNELVETFEDKSIGTLGIIHFRAFSYSQLDKDYGMYTMSADMMTI